MQTFMPYPDYSESARCLDRQRLGKQRVEAFQILRSPEGIFKSAKDIPNVKFKIGFIFIIELPGIVKWRNDWLKKIGADTPYYDVPFSYLKTDFSEFGD